MLVSEVLDRTYSEWLEPAGVDRPATDFLTTTMTGSVPGPGDFFTVEGIVRNIPSHSVVEIDSELIMLKGSSGADLTVAERGWRNSTAASHSVGAHVRVDAKYPRLTLLHHLQSVIGMLQPWGLYRYGVDDTTPFTSRSVLQLPAGAQEIIKVSLRDSTLALENWLEYERDGRDWVLLEAFTPPKYHLRAPGHEGGEMVVQWRGDFTIPADEAADLDTSGVPTTLQPYIPMAVAGTALQGREIPRVQIEEIHRMLAQQGIQIGTALNIGQSMVRAFRLEYVASERRRQAKKDPPRLAWARNNSQVWTY